MRLYKTPMNKYSEAVSLYSTTRLSIKEICGITGDSFKAFSSYLCRNHRDLILARHGLGGGASGGGVGG